MDGNLGSRQLRNKYDYIQLQENVIPCRKRVDTEG